MASAKAPQVPMCLLHRGPLAWLRPTALCMGRPSAACRRPRPRRRLDHNGPGVARVVDRDRDGRPSCRALLSALGFSRRGLAL